MMMTQSSNNRERTWDRVFKRNIEAAEKNSTDVNVELEKEWPGGERWVQEYVAPHLPKGGVAVEIGAGSGRISQWVVPIAGKVYLTDYSAYACDILRGKFPSAQVMQVEDCLFAGIADQTADLVYSISVFGHLFEEQTYTYFREAFRVLRPGGKISIHLIDMNTDVDHFVGAIPAKVDTQRNVFRYLHPDYASLFARHVGFEHVTTERADNTRAYFLTGTRPG
jgi:ubiquinone/menaquinone biosynthesis C-methylase UbiE